MTSDFLFLNHLNFELLKYSSVCLSDALVYSSLRFFLLREISAFLLLFEFVQNLRDKDF